MLASLRKDWRMLKAEKPGHRFQSVHDEHQKHRGSRWTRPIWLAVGVVLVSSSVRSGQ
jgi:hypothetical protein